MQSPYKFEHKPFSQVQVKDETILKKLLVTDWHSNFHGGR